MTHFIDIRDHSADWLRDVLDLSRRLRRERDAGMRSTLLADRTLAMLFEKPSLRTRVSFQQAMYELGGQAISLQHSECGIGERESAADIARVLSGMVHGIMARVFEHAKLCDLAAHATIPVVNALSDDSHPCQALADILTMQDEFGADLAGRTLVFVGDGNNVALSLAQLCARLGIRFILASPPDYRLSEIAVQAIRRDCPDCEVHMTDDPRQAVRDADAIYTDTFISMGQEDEKAQRLEIFRGYQVNQALLDAAPDRAIVLHCLPAYRGAEITTDVLDGPRSRAFPQAHNRLHVQKGLLAVLMGSM